MKELHKKQNNRPVIAILICMFAVTLLFPMKAYATGTGVDSTYVEIHHIHLKFCFIIRKAASSFQAASISNMRQTAIIRLI